MISICSFSTFDIFRLRIPLTIPGAPAVTLSPEFVHGGYPQFQIASAIGRNDDQPTVFGAFKNIWDPKTTSNNHVPTAFEGRIPHPLEFFGLFPISIPGKKRCRPYSVTHSAASAALRPWKSWSMIPKSLRIRLKLGLDPVDPGGMDLSEMKSLSYFFIYDSS